MAEVTELQRKILGSLFFAEPFDNILEEVREPENYIADDLKTLIDKGMVVVMEEDASSGSMKRSFYYDTDNMRAFHYQITSQGLNAYNHR